MDGSVKVFGEGVALVAILINCHCHLLTALLPRTVPFIYQVTSAPIQGRNNYCSVVVSGRGMGMGTFLFQS